MKDKKIYAPTPLGINLQAFLDAKGWSQRKLARLSGVTSAMISQITRGERGSNIGHDTLLKLSVATGIPAEKLKAAETSILEQVAKHSESKSNYLNATQISELENRWKEGSSADHRAMIAAAAILWPEHWPGLIQKLEELSPLKKTKRAAGKRVASN